MNDRKASWCDHLMLKEIPPDGNARLHIDDIDKFVQYANRLGEAKNSRIACRFFPTGSSSPLFSTGRR
jgi:hypothetical protein